MSQTQFPPINAQTAYEEAQRIQGRAQTGSKQEAEQGQKLVPGPKDVTSFDTEVVSDPEPGQGRSSGGKSQGRHHNQARPGKMAD